MSKAKASDNEKNKSKPEKPEKTAAEKARGTRETVESIIIAVILAFLFRAFEAEAFVIPTGSMAPTLQGRHFDLTCAKCGHQYRTGASDESSILTAATCPICRFTMKVDFLNEPDECPMSGDRILVNKFAYEFADPQRWDVIVFKYPGNAKQNYIKRLVGLPGERVRIQYGNVYVKKQSDQGFRIARKSPQKVAAMLHLVDDTKFIPAELAAAGWPSRWQPWPQWEKPAAEVWKPGENGQGFVAEGTASDETWLRYRHLIPSYDDWDVISQGKTPPDLPARAGELISDFYAYNCNENLGMYPKKAEERRQLATHLENFVPRRPTLGSHWVGELALEGEVNVLSDTGELLLELVEGGRHYVCRINLADGEATLAIDGRFDDFQNEQGVATKFPSAATKVKGPGRYRLRLANVDDQVFLWVNGWPVEFDGPTTYGAPRFDTPENVKPAWNPADPGDLAPAGIGVKGASVSVSRLRILRDTYYLAMSKETRESDDYEGGIHPDELESIFSNPESWRRPSIFDRRQFVEFPYASDGTEYFGDYQYFPMGDNSPASQDGRLWSARPPYPPPYVERELLIGKALLVYWPHTWNRPVPYVTPNVQQMGLIR